MASRKKPFSAEAAAVLRDQSISEDAPGPILRDFEIFLGFVEERQARVGGTRGLLHGRALAPLDARLTRRSDVRLQRPVQKSYPYINGLYLLARVTGLVFVEGAGANQMLAPNLPALESWGSLNPTERYFTLLEAWLIEGDGEVIGDRGGAFNRPLAGTLQFLDSLPKDGLRAGDRALSAQELAYFPGPHNLALLDLFGLVTLTAGEPDASGKWRVEAIGWTPFGRALFELLTTADEDHGPPLWFSRALAIEEAGPGETASPLRALAGPYFPEWERTLIVPEDEFRGGAHVFKVSLGPIWRTIAIAGEDVLDDLADAILDSVKFDRDHLYAFQFRDRRGVTVRVCHPYTEDPPLTTDVRVGSVPLLLGQSMTFVFDFGDRWEFTVKLDRVEPDEALAKPKLLESHGKAPKQYGRF